MQWLRMIWLRWRYPRINWTARLSGDQLKRLQAMAVERGWKSA